MSKIVIKFIDDGVLEVTDYDDIETIKDAIRMKEKWVRIEEQIINLDNVAYIEVYRE